MWPPLSAAKSKPIPSGPQASTPFLVVHGKKLMFSSYFAIPVSWCSWLSRQSNTLKVSDGWVWVEVTARQAQLPMRVGFGQGVDELAQICMSCKSRAVVVGLRSVVCTALQTSRALCVGAFMFVLLKPIGM
ncbi:hypothetical protein SLEP1_g2705 [Rubroshorea leprosula]|uniref:Uncharacterized protein n=1 Tax=Rubroshorea leprosula TaxID=152421 RepID=A0AAV5HPK2_9ROSI|nr:hypothetical protein SLEP1_g2705 [Rubroshorea leprosula]